MVYSSRRLRFVRFLSCEEFEERICLSSVAFSPHVISVQDEFSGASSILATDLDNDGDIDVLAATTGVVWYENTDGEGSFSEQRTIATDSKHPWLVTAADVDGDGDLDVMSGSGEIVGWYENTDGLGSFGESKTISTENEEITSLYASDMDGDDDVDLLWTSISDFGFDGGKLVWSENLDGKGSFSPVKTIAEVSVFGGLVPRSVFAADVNGDGKTDILASLGILSTLQTVWYENIGEGTFGDAIVVAEGGSNFGLIHADDVDGDGDIDIITGSDRPRNSLGWYENTDGSGSFSEFILINSTAPNVYSLASADIDGDGDMDVLSASLTSGEKGKVGWYENVDGKGIFGELNILATAAKSMEMESGDAIQSVYI